MEPAFIIGNGPSRKAIDLKDLRPHGTIWGCNALYRDFAPDYLLVIDRKMQQEIVARNYHLENKVIFRDASNKAVHIPEHPNIYTFNNRISSPNNSGAASIYFAMRKGFRNIYLIGFDFERPDTNQQGNVYAGTPCYDRHGSRPPKLPKNITDKIGRWAEINHDKVKFTRVIDFETCRIPDHKGYSEPYMEHITYEQFCERFHIRKRDESKSDRPETT